MGKANVWIQYPPAYRLGFCDRSRRWGKLRYCQRKLSRTAISSEPERIDTRQAVGLLEPTGQSLPVSPRYNSRPRCGASPSSMVKVSGLYWPSRKISIVALASDGRVCSGESRKRIKYRPSRESVWLWATMRPGWRASPVKCSPMRVRSSAVFSL